MATVAESLFGVSPESLLAAREQRLQEQAMQYGKMSPIEAARAGFYEAGSRLGSGIGGLLGAEDPELIRVRQRQELLQGINPSDPASLRKGIEQAMARKDFMLAQELASRATDIETKKANIAKDEAAAQASLSGRTPPDVLKAQRIAALRSAIPVYEASGNKVTTKQLKDELEALLPADKTVSYGEEANRVAAANFGKPFAELTQEQARQVDQILEKRGITKAQAGRSNISTELKIPPNIADAINALENVSKPEVELLTYAQQSKDLINEAVRTKNSQAWESARTVYAKALGQGKLSNEDIQRTGVDPRLIQGALDWVNKKISGIPNEDIMKQLYIVSSILEQNASKRYDEKALRARTSAANTGFKGDLDLYFPTSSTRFGVKSTQSSGAAGTAGSSNVVDWSTMGQKK